MRKSIFSEFFLLCTAIFVASIVCISTIMLVVSGQQYKADRYEAVYKKFSQALDATLGSVYEENGVNTEKLKDIYVPLSDILDADITLTDSDGVALVCSEASPCSHEGKKIERDAFDRITGQGICELSSLNDFYDGEYFIYAEKINFDGSGYCLLTKLQVNKLSSNIVYLVAAAIVSALVILIISLTIMYMSVKRLLMPIKEMTIAAKRFGEGDFSEKLRISDSNELGYLANSLNEMAYSLEQLDETRKTFISNVSHELKTPMTTIGGFIDGILDGTIPPEQHRHYLQIVSTEVDRLSRLVRSMLNISKYEAGELKLSSEDFDIIPVIVRTLLNFEKKIEEKHIEIRGLDRDAFRINADPDLTGQVVYNLTENAVKFVDEGGYISFDFTDGENGMASISIRNSGEGLSKKEISKVFDRFYKTDESRSIDPGGVGLGLSIVNSIIRLHGGTIIVKSEPHSFTEFTFSLKKAQLKQDR